MLVHGIRTYAAWNDKAKQYLEEDAQFVVEPLRYGYFDLLRFLLPLPHFRRRVADAVLEDVSRLCKKHAGAHLSLIAHSFGAYTVCRLLLTRGDFPSDLNALIVCGAVVPDDYPWHLVRKRITHGIRNDHSYVDKWPALARAVTLGYGSIGTYGASDPDVYDVSHEKAHSGYFDYDTFKQWREFVLTGAVVRPAKRSHRKGMRSYVWHSMLSLVSIGKWLAPLAIVVLLTLWLHPPFGLVDPTLSGKWSGRIDWNASYVPTLFGSDAEGVVDPNSIGQVTLYFDHQSSAWCGFSTWELRSGVDRRLAIIIVSLGNFSVAGQAVTFDLTTRYRFKQEQFQYGPYSRYRMRLERQSNGSLQGAMILLPDSAGVPIERVVGGALLTRD